MLPLNKILFGFKNNLKQICKCRNIVVFSRQFTTERYEEETSAQKAVTVAVIGVPNAGKSTFINNLINHRVCPTSNKVHTTRKANKAVFTINNRQLVLFDTPGLVSEREIKKHHLESTFKSSHKHSIQHANVIAVIHDVSNSWTRHELHKTVLNSLEAYPKLPSILVLNKIDTLKSKRCLLDLTKVLTNNTLEPRGQFSNKSSRRIIAEKSNGNVKNEKQVGWSSFSEVFMVSSITGDGLEKVMSFLMNLAQPKKWEYSADTYTDQTPENIIVDSVRARLLDYLPQEIPYSLTSRLEYYSDENNIIYAAVEVACPSPRIERLICGESNGKLKQITERVTSDLVETFGKPISLTIATVINRKSIANMV